MEGWHGLVAGLVVFWVLWLLWNIATTLEEIARLLRSKH